MKKWWIILGIACAGVILWQGISMYRQILSGQEAGQSKAEEIAKDQYGLSRIDSVEYYHGNQAYETVQGTSAKNGKVYVLVGPKNKTKLVKQIDGLTKNQMKAFVDRNLNPKKWVNLRLGMEHDQVLWEAVYLDEKGRYTFYYGYFENGERYKKYSMKQEI
ncbi:DUF5590 domain-containing protein [Fictibacillus sp. WQ 8-8]|uniref:cell wall elongation regulator TseB-like domain-containing protein n=1 Tax=Fictibacillus sp. WQ 8-8 TaxID=2938788 RepID=UPI00210C0761|nr:DUF5590 domain-containing protein [Fictibacillus sp. WQ 8-8]MCQ6265997.1 DUF5590 domain-containing protein [Fictibacillus sp. WQ 8-8]